ncbi:MAG: hypothetical protein IJH82_03035 [Lachnospiraceae bacterium]|nr:hypothetical protein [Lachnospiraceae bacterium]
MGMMEDISDYLKSGESESRDLGLEIEHFIVDENGDQIGFDEISNLISQIGTGIGAEIHYMDGYPVGYYTGEYSTSLEPSCQFEISINPYSDLDRIKEIYGEFRALWEPIFLERGYHFENGGNLPKLEEGLIAPEQIPLSPKSRYKYMNQYFETSGKYGKHMMRASASTQVSIDYSSEEDMARKLRVLQKISPILMIMMENKTNPDFTLQDLSKSHLLRIQEWDDLDLERTGFLKGSLDEDFGYDKMAEIIYKTPLILLADNGETYDVGHLSAEELINTNVLYENEIGQERRKRLIEHFMSMGFFHFRVKKYIEVRVADSVPIEKALGYAAILKGIIYNEKPLNELDERLSNVRTIDDINRAVEEIEKDGFGAVIYEKKTAEEWVDELTDLAAAELDDEEGKYLSYVRTVRNNGR